MCIKTQKVLFFVSLSIGLDCEIDISKSIQNVRAQRSGMVQTEVDATVAWYFFEFLEAWTIFTGIFMLKLGFLACKERLFFFQVLPIASLSEKFSHFYCSCENY